MLCKVSRILWITPASVIGWLTAFRRESTLQTAPRIVGYVGDLDARRLMWEMPLQLKAYRT